MNHVEFSGSHEEEFQTIVVRYLGTDAFDIGITAHRGNIDEILVPLHIKPGLFIGETAIIGELQTGKDGAGAITPSITGVSAAAGISRRLPADNVAADAHNKERKKCFFILFSLYLCFILQEMITFRKASRAIEDTVQSVTSPDRKRWCP